MEISWAVFVVASLALIATPGQDLILVISRSVTQGGRAGLVSAAGISFGLTGHAVLAALGLGAVLRTSETLFLAFKLVGVLYLAYLGIKLLRQGDMDLSGTVSARASCGKLFREGALCNLSNPKVALFYLAFLPQFISPGVSNPTLALIVLGFTFAGLTFLVKGTVGYFGGRLSTWLGARPTVMRFIRRASGGVLIALGVRLAFEPRP